MDTLFYKIFRNIFLFKKIFSYVKNSRFGFSSLKKKQISVIFKDKRLLSQYYQCYLYNKSIIDSNKSKNDKENGNEYNEILFFVIYDPTIINLEMFKTLYCDNLNYYGNTQRLMKWYFSYSDDINIIKYLIDQHSLKIFTISNNDEAKAMANLESYIILLCKNKLFSSKQSSSSSSSCCSSSSSLLSKSDISSRLNILSYLFEIYKKETNKPMDKDIELSYGILLESLNFGCEFEFYNKLFKLCLKDLEKYEISTTKLITKLIIVGNLEVTELYIKEFPNKYCTYEDEIVKLISFAPITNSIYGSGGLEFIFKNLKNSISVFMKLVKNDTITFNKFEQFSGFFYLNYLSIEDYYEVIEYCNKKEIVKRVDTKDSLIIKNVNLKSLKYLIENKSSFTPNLRFSKENLQIHASTMSMDFESFKFIMDSKNDYHFEPFRNKDINLNSNYQIVKHSFENLTNIYYIQFQDIYLTNSYCGDKQLVKYLIQKKIENPGPNSSIKLTYRSLDRVCQNGQIELAKLFIENEPSLKIGISRDAINNAIKSGNLELVEFLKDVELTKPGDSKLIYESSVNYIVQNYRNDIFDSLLNSGYSRILKDLIKSMNLIIPENILKIIN